MFKTLEKIRDLLKETFGTVFKEYVIDDPNLVPFSSLPLIAVAPIHTDIDVVDTGRDTFTYAIDVILIIDAKQELLKYKKEMVGTQFLTEIMEARDDNGNLQANTILYVLRNNLTLGSNWYIENISSIDYSLRTRTTEGGEQFVTKEAACRLSVIQVTTRS